jgi:hypothetical protein
VTARNFLGARPGPSRSITVYGVTADEVIDAVIAWANQRSQGGDPPSGRRRKS